MVSAITNIIRDIDFELFETINQTETIRKITNSISWHELSSITNGLIQIITAKFDNTDNKSYSYYVQRALNMIDEHYSQGITLEKIADSLHITPEYLGLLINKETGKSFSLFLKEHRINIAKKLLLDTELKSYVIASTLGFSDSKYFFRVFKEITGLSTGEYVRKYK